MKRPRGITVICLVLGWLGFAGVANALTIFAGLFEPLPTYIGFFAVAYAITAVVASVLLWQMKQRGLTWLRYWMAACIATMVAIIPSFGQFALGGYWGLAAFSVFSLVLLWMLNYYVVKQLRGVSP